MGSFRIFIAFGFLLLTACQSYYIKQQKYNYYFEKGNYTEAEKRYLSLEKPKGHNELLYFMNMGAIKHLEGQYQQSNQFFEKAYFYSQDYHKNVTADFASVFVGSSVNKYLGNPLEVLLINYYKALNYVLLNQNGEAMVECRRAFQALQYLDDKYVNNNKYQRDPYIYNAIGLIFEAGGEYNTALVCLKRAVDIYKKDNVQHFGIGVPEQLKYDVIRLAKKSGDFSAADQYLVDFGKDYDTKPVPPNMKEAVVFWHNGLAPVKTESNVMFTINNNGGGNLIFMNDDIGLQIPVYFPINSSNSSALNSLTFIRMALPKYRERKLVYTRGEVFIDSTHKLTLVLGQDFNAVDYKILKDQFAATLSQALIRVTMRQIAVMATSQKNDLLSTGLAIASFVVEKADTRNWQSLPHSAYYTRVLIPEGQKTIQLRLYGDDPQPKLVDVKVDSLSKDRINFINVVTPDFSRY